MAKWTVERRSTGKDTEMVIRRKIETVVCRYRGSKSENSGSGGWVGSSLSMTEDLSKQEHTKSVFRFDIGVETVG